MAARKIAENLRGFVSAWAEVERNETEGGRAPLAEREMRALLAVARAADRLLVRRPGYFIVRDGIEHAKPLRDALDRLARLSGRSRKDGRHG